MQMALFFSFWWDLLLYTVILLTILYYSLIRNYGYWKRKGVPGPKPHFIFGNMKNAIFGRITINEEFANIYQETKHHPYAGIFMMQRPTLLVNDLDLIRNILAKDFAHFTDRAIKSENRHDPIANNLFRAGGSEWKNMRVKMTPTFTSSKMREMFNTVADCCQEMVLYLNEQRDDRIEDLKELFGKLNTDIIGTCAFGIDCNSFKNPDSKFREMGKRFFNPPFMRTIVRFLTFFIPKIMHSCQISLLGRDMNDFFYSVVKDVVEYRKEHGVVRHDFMQIMIQMLKEDEESGANNDNKLTLHQISAQVFVFFVAGFETSSSVASFAMYELALNPDIQDKLVKEIKESSEKYSGKITYDSLNEMTYLGQVIDETMRKYPVGATLLRMCTKDYLIPNSDVVIEKGTPVMIPVLGVQRDPDIYPNPDKFDPDRFSNEGKASRHNFAYLPFGEGPRICIGNRFGLMQTKLAIVAILSKFEVSVCDKTTIPMVFDPRGLVLSSKGGAWLRLKNRAK